MRVCLAACQAAGVVVRSQSNLRRRCAPYHTEPERTHGRRAAFSARGPARIPHDRVRARTFLNADTRHWPSQGLRRECLLHIQGLHLHCGLLESCTPFPRNLSLSRPLLLSLCATTPWSLVFFLFLLARVRALRRTGRFVTRGRHLGG